jgi:hypothetical protein
MGAAASMLDLISSLSSTTSLSLQCTAMSTSLLRSIVTLPLRLNMPKLAGEGFDPLTDVSEVSRSSPLAEISVARLLIVIVQPWTVIPVVLESSSPISMNPPNSPPRVAST